jgi:hypothetical protein
LPHKVIVYAYHEAKGMATFGGPWSRLKLDCVENYAVAYLKVMQQQNWSLHYVDAFAGQGRQQLKLVASHPDSQSEDQASFGIY